mgnify:CR=1 FL=1
MTTPKNIQESRKEERAASFTLKVLGFIGCVMAVQGARRILGDQVALILAGSLVVGGLLFLAYVHRVRVIPIVKQIVVPILLVAAILGIPISWGYVAGFESRMKADTVASGPGEVRSTTWLAYHAINLYSGKEPDIYVIKSGSERRLVIVHPTADRRDWVELNWYNITRSAKSESFTHIDLVQGLTWTKWREGWHLDLSEIETDSPVSTKGGKRSV